MNLILRRRVQVQGSSAKHFNTLHVFFQRTSSRHPSSSFTFTAIVYNTMCNSTFFSVFCFAFFCLHVVGVECYLQVTAGSEAAQVDLCPGDIILAINGCRTEHLTHSEALNLIKRCTHNLSLSISR